MDQKKKKITLALLTAMFLAAFDSTVIAAAAPVIVKDLQGFELISWIFSLYLLTSAISTPIYGKLADLYGRKKILSLGILIFLVGSLCCGFAQTMYQLAAYRGLQGLGAGAIFTVTFTIIGDIFTLKERSVVQGAISTVWGVAGLLGPVLGGFLIDALSWRWIFFINIPFALFCVVCLNLYLHDSVEHKNPTIDYIGTILLSAAIGVFLYGVMVEQQAVYQVIDSIGSLLIFVVFYFVEKNAVEPIVPVWILTKSTILINIVTFLVSMLLIAINVYMPFYIQLILGYSATIAGITLVSMSISWFYCSTMLAAKMERYGAKNVVLVASILLIVSMALLCTVSPETSLWMLSCYGFLFGIGFSGTLNTLMFTIQDSVGYANRGAAIGFNTLIKTLAQTIGISVFGACINTSLAAYFKGQAQFSIDINNLASPENGLSLLEIQTALFSAVHYVFLLLLVISLLNFVFAYFLPKETEIESKPI